MEDVSPEVAALLRSQMQATGRRAEEAPALTGEDAPPSRGRGRAGSKATARGAKAPARTSKSTGKPGKATKPGAKVALVKKAASRAKPKRSKGA